jgi:hypothetical protein
VRFGLQFDASQAQAGEPAPPVAAAEQRQKPVQQAVSNRLAATSEEQPGGADGEDSAGAKVIRFDPRRKR